jgi:hypothetical protein
MAFGAFTASVSLPNSAACVLEVFGSGLVFGEEAPALHAHAAWLLTLQSCCHGIRATGRLPRRTWSEGRRRTPAYPVAGNRDLFSGGPLQIQ